MIASLQSFIHYLPTKEKHFLKNEAKASELLEIIEEIVPLFYMCSNVFNQLDFSVT